MSSSSSYSTASYSESTQSLVASKSQTKDYSRAFAELSTSYGFGVAPMLPQTTAAPSRSSFFGRKRASAKPVPQAAVEPKAQAKDFSSALANLQTSYGFQGAPVLPSSSH
ncbi:hypothetical protein DL93DRAFT_1888292 [Clavulina sp. PMI_390]|nr:hypothetical protein DL93DRAFT_1888292 [Clavulina sp. PMI_390]